MARDQKKVPNVFRVCSPKVGFKWTLGPLPLTLPKVCWGRKGRITELSEAPAKTFCPRVAGYEARSFVFRCQGLYKAIHFGIFLWRTVSRIGLSWNHFFPGCVPHNPLFLRCQQAERGLFPGEATQELGGQEERRYRKELLNLWV